VLNRLRRDISVTREFYGLDHDTSISLSIVYLIVYSIQPEL
jgi:hypothetical protein